MAEGVTLTLNELGFTASMEGVLREVGGHMGWVLDWQMALLCKDAILKLGGQQGLPIRKKAVRSDIERLFASPTVKAAWPMGEGSERSWGIKLSGGGVYQLGAFYYSPDISMESMTKFHNQKRMPSNGRVGMGWEGGQYGGRQSGKGSHRQWRGVDVKMRNIPLQFKIHVPKNILREYISMVQSHIGRTKAAWCEAADYFAAKAQGWVSNMYPEWVGRNKGWAYSNGYSIREDTVDAIAMTGHVTSGTGVPWARDDGLLESLVENRKHDIEKGYALTRLKGICAKYSARSAS
jgi:hypothetical protein